MLMLVKLLGFDAQGPYWSLSSDDRLSFTFVSRRFIVNCSQLFLEFLVYFYSLCVFLIEVCFKLGIFMLTEHLDD